MVVDEEERRRPAFWRVFWSVTSFVSGSAVLVGVVIVVVVVVAVVVGGVGDVVELGVGVRVSVDLGFLRIPSSSSVSTAASKQDQTHPSVSSAHPQSAP